jgi:hypothetical protein
MATTKSNAASKDACDLLDKDHRAVKLFKQFEELSGSKSKRAATQRREIAMQICRELTVHAQIEEEIFYPALRNAIKDTDLLAEAEVEHATAKDLIAQIESGDMEDEAFNARVTVLGEYIDHRVKEERNEIFPKARTARRLDLISMRAELEMRKAALMGESAAGKSSQVED